MSAGTSPRKRTISDADLVRSLPVRSVGSGPAPSNKRIAAAWDQVQAIMDTPSVDAQQQ